MFLASETKSEKHVPLRTCAGCREVSGRDELVRFVHVPEHTPCLVPDKSGTLPGHGLWLHARASCARRAVRGGFARVLRRSVQLSEAEVVTMLNDVFTRRLQGLLVASLRRHQLAMGSDAVREALAAGAARLLLVAKDAAGRREELCRSAGERDVPVVVLADKSELGRLTGKETLGFIAVLDSRMAREITASAQALAGLAEDG